MAEPEGPSHAMSVLAATDRVPFFVREIARRPFALFGAVLFVLMVFAAIAAPLISPFSPYQQDLTNFLAGPSAHHLLGTDSLGRDVLSRLIYGARPAFVGAGEAFGVAVVVAVPLGLVAGYFAGWIDATIARVVDIVLSIPAIMFLLVIVAVFSGNQNAVLVAFGFLVSPGLIRVVRSVTLSVRRELFVEAARVSGVNESRIVFRHILPLILGPVIVQGTLIAAGAVLVEAALGFLGLGPQPPQASWGEMVSEASLQLSRQPWLVVPPGAVLILAVLSLGLIGDAVRDIAAERLAPVERRPARTRVRVAGNDFAGVDAVPEASTKALLSVRGLSVAFSTREGDLRVVDGVSFDIRRGETVGLLGESGCGKTITSLAMMRLLPPGGRIVAGSCSFEGRDLARSSRAELAAVRGRQIAMISQEPMVALDPVFTVGNQLLEAVRRHDGSSRRQAAVRVRDLLEKVELRDYERVMRLYPHELSGGMAQRVVIALALAGRPKLVIADEPTTALDVTVQAEILELLRTLQEETGLAILLVTHNWGVVADSCQRAVIMYAGQVVEYGDVDALFERPLHPYTEGLLLSNPEQAEPGTDLPTIPGSVPAPTEWPLGCRFAPRCTYRRVDCSAGPIALATPAAHRLSRCIHIESLIQARTHHAH